MKYITPVDHKEERKAVHPSQRQLHVQPISSDLHVVTVIFNPVRYASRYNLYHGFEKHCECSGAILHTVELALRDRHHEVTTPDNPNHIQLRTEDELWFKENGGNVALRHLPHDWEYVAFVDADFTFTRPDWVNETLHQLQHYDAVQMFSNITYLSSQNAVLNNMYGFAYSHLNHLDKPAVYGQKGAVGGAWAFRRSAMEKLGGLLETCIVGSGDWHMAFAMAMRKDYHPDLKLRGAPQYIRSIQEWQERAASLRGNVGYMDSNVIHHWHGPMRYRGYGSRWEILTRNSFDPYTDLWRDWQGALKLNKNKPQLRDDLRAYFRSRNEDMLG